MLFAVYICSWDFGSTKGVKKIKIFYLAIMIMSERTDKQISFYLSMLKHPGEPHV